MLRNVCLRQLDLISGLVSSFVDNMLLVCFVVISNFGVVLHICNQLIGFFQYAIQLVIGVIACSGNFLNSRFLVVIFAFLYGGFLSDIRGGAGSFLGLFRALCIFTHRGGFVDIFSIDMDGFFILCGIVNGFFGNFFRNFGYRCDDRVVCDLLCINCFQGFFCDGCFFRDICGFFNFSSFSRVVRLFFLDLQLYNGDNRSIAYTVTLHYIHDCLSHLCWILPTRSGVGGDSL